MITPQYDIILLALNARYIHTSFGLRYLRANLAELEDRSLIVEIDINQRVVDIVAKILAYNPKIIGLGLYIWNVDIATRTVVLLRQIAPAIKLVLGGPEISYETTQQDIFKTIDYVVIGPGERAFYQLCRAILDAREDGPKIIAAAPVALSEIKSPYAQYTQEDILHRIIYVEVSRGCPFKCEFCLSSLDKKVNVFQIDAFLLDLDKLYRKGARQFKFVDRTFNLKIKICEAILNFFLQRLSADLFLHFEVIPDRLPVEIKQLLVQFPIGTLQLEIGIQTFNPVIQERISRRQDNQQSIDNLHWLKTVSNAYLHVDLIFGLPGEAIDSIEVNFNQLFALQVHEIQCGILKRLRGTPIIRHSEKFAMIYNYYAPYELMQNDTLSFNELQRLKRFARYWDLIGNSGHFSAIIKLLLQCPSVFLSLMAFSDWLFAKTDQTHQFSLQKLFEFVYSGLLETSSIKQHDLEVAIRKDYAMSKLANKRIFLDKVKQNKKNRPLEHSQRQHRHH